MKRSAKKLSSWPVLVIDILLAAAILLTFCYFHHVRVLWGDNGSEEIIDSFEKEENNENKDPAQVHLEHDWKLAETVASDCTQGGYKKYTCECGDEKYTDRTEPLGHGSTVLEGKIDTAEQNNGFTGDLVCSVCNEVLVKGWETPAYCHKEVVLINKADSTCKEQGYSGDWLCNDDECGKIVAKGAPMPLSDHSYAADTVVGATCQSEGYTVYRCTVCSAEKKSDYLDRTDHRMNNEGFCVYCEIFMADTSGDFGASFPLRFLQDDGTLTLSSDAEIRAYAKEHGIELQDRPDGEFIHFYRSHDVYISLIDVNTTLYYNKIAYKVNYFVYDVYVRNIENLFTVTASSGRQSIERLIAMGEDANGSEIIAAVNGDFTGNKNHCLVSLRNGDLMRTKDYIESDLCVLNFDGTMDTYTPATYDWETIAAKNPYQIWNFGPSLLDINGKAIEEFSNASYDGNVIGTRNPRTALGYYEPGHYSLISVDGRSRDSGGVIMASLALLAEDLGCARAYNMDGGDSAQAHYMDEAIRVDEDRFEAGESQRRLWDIICIGEVSKND